MRSFKNLTILTALFLLTSCAYNSSMVRTSYDILSVSQVTYTTAMQIAADLYKSGHLTPNAKAEIIELGQAYSLSHNAAVDALSLYEQTKDAPTLDVLEANIKLVTSTLNKLLTFLRPYLGAPL